MLECKLTRQAMQSLRDLWRRKRQIIVRYWQKYLMSWLEKEWDCPLQDGSVLGQTLIVKRGHILNLVHTSVFPYTNSTTNNPYTTLALHGQLSTNFNPLNAELKPICHLLALLGAHHILHVGRIRVNITSK